MKHCPSNALIATIGALLTFQANAGADTERMTPDSLRTALSQAQGKGRPQLADKNFAHLSLSGIDFLGANLSASVFNGAKLDHARFDKANLTVSFFEGADMTGASFHDAMMFSVQVAGGTLRDADLSGARLIGDLSKTDLTDAKLTHMNAAADMKNQSMGLMHTSLVKAKASGADFSNSDFSRSEFSFADLTGAKMVNTKLVRTDFSGAVLAGADLSGADLSDSQLIDADLSHANLTNANFTGANLQGVRGLDTAVTKGARGLP